jgi:hypothetical protein
VLANLPLTSLVELAGIQGGVWTLSDPTGVVSLGPSALIIVLAKSLGSVSALVVLASTFDAIEDTQLIQGTLQSIFFGVLVRAAGGAGLCLSHPLAGFIFSAGRFGVEIGTVCETFRSNRRIVTKRVGSAGGLRLFLALQHALLASNVPLTLLVLGT